MNGAHLTEETIQQFALDRGATTPETIAHLDTCADCRAAAAVYGLLMEGLKDHPPPVFAFDLATMVTARLESEQSEPMTVPATGPETSGQFWVVAVSLLIAAVPAWLFRKSAYFFFSDMSGGFSGLLAGISGFVLLLSIYRYYRHYQKVLHFINK